jgi:hypothetical protein
MGSQSGRATVLDEFFELGLRRGVEAEGDFLAHDDDRAAQVAAVGGEPRDQLGAREAFGLGAPLGRDQLLGVADQLGQRLDLFGVELLFDEVAQLETALTTLAREKLSRLDAAGSARFPVEVDHAFFFSMNTPAPIRITAGMPAKMA